MTERETELKYLLEATTHEQLPALLGPALASKSLVNRYFVPDQPSERQDWVLRLRTVEGAGNELTLKMGREVSPGIFDSLEHSCRDVATDPSNWEDLEPLKLFRKEISSRPLICQGESRTQRLVFGAPVEAGTAWELDVCTLPGGQRFAELEIELTPAQSERLEHSRSLVESWFHEQGVRFEVSRKTKYRRFLEAL